MSDGTSNAAFAGSLYQQLTELPPSVDRFQTAAHLLRALLAERQLPPDVAAHWLVQAQPLLAGNDRLEMFIQHDDVLQIVTIEFWRDGATVFGTEAWVG
jgi:hypothetical protein